MAEPFVGKSQVNSCLGGKGGGETAERGGWGGAATLGEGLSGLVGGGLILHIGSLSY